MTEDTLEDQKTDIGLEKYRIRYGLYKVLFGTALVGIIGVLVPGAVEFWKATFENQRLTTQFEIENKRKQLEIELDQINQQQAYVKDFLETALNQDIELRIRFADYFSKVSADPFRKDWTTYRDALVETRNITRSEIHLKEEALLRGISLQSPTIEQQIGNAKLSRELEWRYREIGYLARDRSIVRSESEAEDTERSFSSLINAESILNSEPKWEPVRDYNSSSRIGRYRELVGRIKVKTDDGFVLCTGFIISANEVLTASYCVEPSNQAAQNEQVRFLQGYYGRALGDSSLRRFKMTTVPSKIDRRLEFALIGILHGSQFPAPVNVPEFRAPKVGEPILILHHPRGAPMSVSTLDCRILEVHGQTFKHSCSTAAGSSGAPIFGSDDGAIIGMQTAGSSLDVGPRTAIRADRIQEAIAKN